MPTGIRPSTATSLPELKLHRRHLLGSMAALPLTAGLAPLLLNPEKAKAAAMSLNTVTITSSDGREISAALARPEGSGKAPAVLLIHEWWGLNDQIRTMAAELARKGFLALAVDLYDGEVGTTPEEADALRRKVDPDSAYNALGSWISWLKTHEDSTGKVGTLGWCFGGGWSLNASTRSKVDATVIYYGRVDLPRDQIAELDGPVLGHFATRDAHINPDMVGRFEAQLDEEDKDFEIYWYVADHAFANPTTARYDEDDAALSWARSLAFLTRHLMEGA